MLTKRLVEMLAGHIWVSSVPGRGTSVTIELPEGGPGVAPSKPGPIPASVVADLQRLTAAHPTQEPLPRAPSIARPASTDGKAGERAPLGRRAAV